MKKKPAAAWPPSTALGLPARIPRRTSRARFVPTGYKNWTRCPRPAQILGVERLLITHHSPARRSLGEGEPLIAAFSIDTSAIENHLNSFKISGPIRFNRHPNGGYPNRLLVDFFERPESVCDPVTAAHRSVPATQIGAQLDKIVGLLALARLIREGDAMKSYWSRLIWAGLLVGLWISPPVRAQQSGTTPPAKPATAAASRPDAIENDVTLHLSDDQKTKIKAIRDDADLQVQAVGKDTTLTDDQKERRVKLIHKETRAKVFAVLTPDQQKTWGAEQHERHEARSSKPKSE
jgi:hypothetical protein